ncbi:hypothetical protein [Erythrobacter sp.]|uniref:hypothetical protein n=1 Tax=Erythrobacter sp. TaxID=1042 RepID=UPI001425F109|nr:hypothetical protein [Erythrobacter sp.]QIQ85825.1 MAG: hypothetical protein G9473_03340 [Erythrobacter sp.]
MPSLLAYAAPLALLVPMMGQGMDVPLADRAEGQEGIVRVDEGIDREEPEQASPRALPPAPLPATAPLSAFREGQVAHQVRIEQRVVVRISPARPTTRQQLLATLPREEVATRYEERKMAKCLPVERIAGVQTGSGNRLVLFLKDKRMVTVNLEKTCRARDFYSGFYVEKNEDGKLCVDRDRIKSRTGLKCEVERMRQLVAVEE